MTIPSLPIHRDALLELEAIVDAIADQFPSATDPLTLPLVHLVNWLGRQQLAAEHIQGGHA